MNCEAKHTKHQPTDNEWSCPHCDSDTVDGLFYIETIADNAEEGCQLLHEEDLIVCHACDKQWSGKALTDALKKKSSLVVCPHCKGKGVVPK